jgi:hypothetical protein
VEISNLISFNGGLKEWTKGIHKKRTTPSDEITGGFRYNNQDPNRIPPVGDQILTEENIRENEKERT